MTAKKLLFCFHLFVFFVLLSFTNARSAYAVVLWYNGDFGYNPPATTANGIINGINTAVPAAQLYEDFNVPTGGWTINSVFSQDLMGFEGVTQAVWEIRGGVSAGDGGTLVAGGTGSATQTDLNNSFAGYEIYEIRVSGLDFFLPEGTYWLSVAPVGFGPTPIFDNTDQSFISSSGGDNAVGTPAGDNGYAFFTSSAFSAFFVPSTDFIPTPDYSMGVDGLEGNHTVIPEPSTLLLISTGLLGFGIRRKR